MRQRKSPLNYEKIWPERVCPICGKHYLMRVRPDEWGYGSRDGVYSKPENNHLHLFCSRPCMDEYTRRCLEARVEKVKASAAFRVWWMYDQEYMEVGEIAEKLGYSYSSVANMLNAIEGRHWRELDYILTTA